MLNLYNTQIFMTSCCWFLRILYLWKLLHKNHQKPTDFEWQLRLVILVKRKKIAWNSGENVSFCNILKISSVFPQHDGPQTAIKRRSFVEKIFLIISGSVERTLLYKKEAKTKMFTISLKKTSLISDIAIGNNMMKIWANYTTSDLGIRKMQNFYDLLS